MKLTIKSNTFWAILLLLSWLGTSPSLNRKLFAQTTKTVTSKSDFITTMTFSKSGRYFVTGGSSKLVEVWDMTSNERIKEMKGHSEVIVHVSVSSNEKIIVSASDSKAGVFNVKSELIIWDLDAGTAQSTISAAPYIKTLSFNEDGTMITIGAADKTQVFSVDDGTKAAEIKTKKMFNYAGFKNEDIISLLIPYEIKDKHFFIKNNNFTLKTFNSMTGNELNSFSTPEYWEMLVKYFELFDINISAVPPQTEILSVYKAENANLLFILKPNNLIDIWDSMEGLKLATLQKGFAILLLAIEPSGRYIATSGDNNLISLWDLASMPEVASRMATK